MDYDENQRLKKRPDAKFINSIQLPRDNSAIFLEKGQSKRMFQAYRNMLVGHVNGSYGIRTLKTNERALEELQTEVAILLFWGWKIVEIVAKDPKICCAPSYMFD